jgi:phosphoenolpyruvate-protein kinase (PTS system EI component)
MNNKIIANGNNENSPKEELTISGSGVINLGIAVPKARIVVWKQPSIFDEIDFSTIKPPSHKTFKESLKKTMQAIDEKKENLIKNGEHEIADVYDVFKMILSEIYELNSSKLTEDNIAIKIIQQFREMIPLFIMKNRDDIDEMITFLLKELGVEYFQKDFNGFIKDELEKGAFVLVSNKFPLDSMSLLGKENGVQAFIGAQADNLTPTSHPVLVATSKGIPVLLSGHPLDYFFERNDKNISIYPTNIDQESKKEANIIFNPTQKDISYIKSIREKQVQEIKRKNEVLSKEKSIGADSLEFNLNINIDSLEALDSLTKWGVFNPNTRIGIGLVRTEILYEENVHNYEFLLNANEQVSYFDKLFTIIDNKVPVRIRLLDQDASKLTGLQSFARGKELVENNLAVYQAQVNAILQAASLNNRDNVQILVPQLHSLAHVQLIKNIISSQLEFLGLKDTIRVDLNAMIEDVQILYERGLLEKVLDEVDAINLGTNDFGQSIGQDRLNSETQVSYNPLEFFMYEAIIKLAIEKGKSPCVCGATAKDIHWAKFFTSLGASVSPDATSAPIVKEALIDSKRIDIDMLMQDITRDKDIKKMLDFIKNILITEKLKEQIAEDQYSSHILVFISDRKNLAVDDFIYNATSIANFYQLLQKEDIQTKNFFRTLLRQASSAMELIINKL